MRPNFKLIRDFIIPHLERQTYGRHLMWEDREKGSFKVSRIHQSSELWSDDCITVYKAWSQEKKLWKLDDTKRITKAKHRLITALRRSPVIEVLKKESSYYRFQFTQPIKTDQNTSIDDSNDSGRLLLELKSNKDFNNDTGSSSCTYEKQPKVKEVYITVINRTTNSDPGLNVSSQELENEFKNEEFAMLNESGDIYLGAHNSDEDNNTWLSGKCCCDILLDSTLLCNERCIWHGIYT